MATLLSRMACVAAALWLAVLQAGTAAEPSRSQTLRLRNGDYVLGEWTAVGEAAAGTLQWRSAAFAQPLEVPWEQVQSIQEPVRSEPTPTAPSLFLFELTSGESLQGNLTALSAETLEIASPRFGPLRLPRGAVRQFFRLQATDTVAVGPRGLEGWYSARPDNPNLGLNPWAQNPNLQINWLRSSTSLRQWSDRDAPSTANPGAQLRSEFELPAQAEIELDLSWQKKAGFTIVIGAGLEGNRDRTAFRCEVWDRELVLVREDDQAAIVRPLLTLPPGNGQVRLRFFHDRAANRLIVFSGGGIRLADVTFALSAPSKSPQAVRRVGGQPRNVPDARGQQANQPGNRGEKEVTSPVPQRKEPSELVITNVLGDLRLDGFRVVPWNGIAPTSVGEGQSRLQWTDGRVAVAEPIAFDGETQMLRVKEGGGDRSEPLAAVSRVVMSEQRMPIAQPGLHLQLHDGSRLFGEPLPSPAGRLRLRHASFEQTLDMPIDAIRSVLTHYPVSPANTTAAAASPNTQANGSAPATPAGPVNPAAAANPAKPANPAGQASLPATAGGPANAAPPSLLEWSNGSLTGTLVDGERTADSTGLVWKPLAAVAPVTLRRDFSGRIACRPAAKPGPSAESPNANQANDNGANVVVVNGGGPAIIVAQMARVARGLIVGAGDARQAVNESGPAAGPQNGPASSSPAGTPLHRLHLRGGEVIPCQKLAIDADGLRIVSKVTAAQRIAHDQVKAIEMLPTAKPPLPARVKRERLLMVPRVDRAHPPTHIVRSRDADYLRGRLLGLDDEFLTIEVRMEVKRVPRDLVSHIIWINPDELAPAGSEATNASVPAAGQATAGQVVGGNTASGNLATGNAPTGNAPTGNASAGGGGSKTVAADTPASAAGAAANLKVLALRIDGVRIGFEPQRCRNGELIGENPNLGEVRVAVHEVDQFLIGSAVGEAVAATPYAKWRWTSATLPKIAAGSGSDSGGSRQPGMDSPLVGKPAPDFKLPMLAGMTEFELGKQRGRVVVLDFWATWCGPCLKTIPVLEKVVREQPAEARVDLIAVNLEEAPKQITAMLERHGWKLTVALDRDGAVAGKYAATAIPQTVIIDREGKVARLFVGGGPQFEAELRAALAQVTAPPPPQAGGSP